MALAAPRRPDLEGWKTPYRHTPFHPRTSEWNLNGSWVPWAGYLTAGTYEDETMEYFALRNQAGVYDISPMVKYRISGRDSAAYLDRLQLRSIAKLKAGRVMYTAWCDGDGMLIDDGTLFRLGETDFRLCCQERMLPWLLDSAIGFEVEIRDETEAVAGLTLQGPLSYAVLQRAGVRGVETLKPFALGIYRLDGREVMISRTGFSGDLGYELWMAPEDALGVWDHLFEAGRLHGLRPYGNTALNLARIEAGLIMAAADFVNAEHALRRDRPRSPYELGLGWMVDLGKGHFNGRRALAAEHASGSSRYAFVGLDIEGNIPATGSLVYYPTGINRWDEAGHVTAAAWSPTLKRNIAMASLKRPYGISITEKLVVEIYVLRELVWQKLMVRARIVERPFLKLARRTAMPPGLV
ncbi:MAG: aminomethyltransferase family protein [Hyphomicrobiaceae bacterium]